MNDVWLNPSDFAGLATCSWRRLIGNALTGGTAVPGLPLRQLLFGAAPIRDVLAGRTVLVTGASSGIGRAVALKAAAAGAVVVIVARSVEKLGELRAEIESLGGTALSYQADLSSRKSADALLGALAADGIEIDVLVNNAGRSIRRPLDASYERLHDFERTMALNYFGALRLILGTLPGMRARKRGHVINVSSAGVQTATPLFSAYIASKAALDAFTRVAAGEARKDGIRFTTVHMPLVRTPMIAPTEEFRDAPALTTEEAADLVLRAVTTGESHLGTRMGTLLNLGHLLVPEVVERLIAWSSERKAPLRQTPAPDPLDAPFPF